MMEPSADDFLVVHVTDQDDYWMVSSLLSEQAIAAGGVDVLQVVDDTYCRSSSAAGCFLVVTKRVGHVTPAQWSRENDNRLRCLKEAKETRTLSDEEEEELSRLTPLFQAFLSQGLGSMGQTKSRLYVCWLPYCMLMAINPGLLSPKARRSVESVASLPTKGTYCTIPPEWGDTMVIPASRMTAVKRGGSIIGNRSLSFLHVPPGEPNAIPVTLSPATSVRATGIEFGPFLIVTKVAPSSPADRGGIKEGYRLLAVDGRAVSTYEEVDAAMCCESVEVIVAPIMVSGPVVFKGGGVNTVLHDLSELDILDEKKGTRNTFLVNSSFSSAA